MSELKIENLHVSVEGKEILKGVNLVIKKGEIHALMGPNGSGKSTLSFALMGHPKYEITGGKVTLDGKNLFEMEVDERAKAGLFLSFQYPSEIPGVSLANFLRTAYNEVKYPDSEKKVNIVDFMKLLYGKMELLKMDKEFAKRHLNVGFSGGEKKRTEILQLAVLEPKFAILDETDSGLDVDALRVVAAGVKKLVGPHLGVLVITHYQRILHHIKPHFVHILVDGKIVKSGDYRLAEDVEKSGYEIYEKEKMINLLRQKDIILKGKIENLSVKIAELEKSVSDKSVRLKDIVPKKLEFEKLKVGIEEKERLQPQPVLHEQVEKAKPQAEKPAELAPAPEPVDLDWLSQQFGLPPTRD